MSAEQTYTTLVEMGLDQAVAREAAKRYDANVERAAEWCLGDGMTVSTPLYHLSKSVHREKATADRA